MNNKNRIRMLTEGGMMIALSTLLSQIRIYQAPSGGSVTAGSMVPIIIFAIKWGTKPGLVVGSLYGILHFILKPYFLHWGQFLLDYPIPYGLLGLAGLAYNSGDSKFNEYPRIILAVSLGLFGRLIAHVLAGVIFFAEAAGGKNPLIYSILYNISYLLPELIISIIILIMLWKPLKRTILDNNIRN